MRATACRTVGRVRYEGPELTVRADRPQAKRSGGESGQGGRASFLPKRRRPIPPTRTQAHDQDPQAAGLRSGGTETRNPARLGPAARIPEGACN